MVAGAAADVAVELLANGVLVEIVASPTHDVDRETGVVTGTCGQTGAGYTYAVSAAAKGTVMIDAATGIWAYRPVASARHEAALDQERAPVPWLGQLPVSFCYS